MKRMTVYAATFLATISMASAQERGPNAPISNEPSRTIGNPANTADELAVNQVDDAHCARLVAAMDLLVDVYHNVDWNMVMETRVVGPADGRRDIRQQARQGSRTMLDGMVAIRAVCPETWRATSD